MSAGTPERGAPTEVVLDEQARDALADAILGDGAVDERSNLADAILELGDDTERRERQREARILRARLRVEPTGADWRWYTHNIAAALCECTKCTWSPERKR